MIKAKFKMLCHFYKHNNKIRHEILHSDIITLDFWLDTPGSFDVIEEVINNLDSSELLELVEETIDEESLCIEFLGNICYNSDMVYSSNGDYVQEDYYFEDIKYLIGENEYV